MDNSAVCPSGEVKVLIPLLPPPGYTLDICTGTLWNIIQQQPTSLVTVTQLDQTEHNHLLLTQTNH